MVRVILAGIVGGALVFCGGAFNHMVLGLEGRVIQHVPDEAGMRAHIAKQKLAPGIYGFPHMAAGYEKMSGAEQEKEWKRVGDLYKEGPAAYLVVAPTGEEMMSGKELGSEFLTNALAALIAAGIVSLTAPGTSFLMRWAIVLNLGLFTWLSTSASYAIWYRFPGPFILDGLISSLIEWGVAGLVIAAIAMPKTTPPSP